MSKLILKDWRKRLQKAVRRGRFTVSDKGKAGSWLNCAIGERDHLCKGLIKLNDALSTNRDVFVKHTFHRIIFQLGLRFSTAVDYNEFVKVQDIIEQIEGLEVQEFYK